jgi:hypothetical protein
LPLVRPLVLCWFLPIAPPLFLPFVYSLVFLLYFVCSLPMLVQLFPMDICPLPPSPPLLMLPSSLFFPTSLMALFQSHQFLTTFVFPPSSFSYNPFSYFYWSYLLHPVNCIYFYSFLKSLHCALPTFPSSTLFSPWYLLSV